MESVKEFLGTIVWEAIWFVLFWTKQAISIFVLFPLLEGSTYTAVAKIVSALPLLNPL